MRVGDMVMFYSSFEPFGRGYVKRNPGVVLKITQKERISTMLGANDRVSVEVYWADQSITTAHSTYLQPVEKAKGKEQWLKQE